MAMFVYDKRHIKLPNRISECQSSPESSRGDDFSSSREQYFSQIVPGNLHISPKTSLGRNGFCERNLRAKNRE